MNKPTRAEVAATTLGLASIGMVCLGVPAAQRALEDTPIERAANHVTKRLTELALGIDVDQVPARQPYVSVEDISHLTATLEDGEGRFACSDGSMAELICPDQGFTFPDL